MTIYRTDALRRVLIQARRSRGFTQEQLAHAMGTSKQVINRYECGRQTIGLTNLWYAAHALGIPASELVRRAEEEDRG